MSIRASVSRCLVILTVIFLMTSLSGCSTTSSGFGIGMVGSEHWHGRASKAEITALWRTKSLEKLENAWNRNNYNKPKTRRAISMELERRGLDGQMFYDPAADYKRQAEAQELGQAFSQALQEVNRVNQAGPGAGTTNGSGPKNVTYQTIGNNTYGSDGTSYQTIGNTIYGSDGTMCQKIGNMTYCN